MIITEGGDVLCFSLKKEDTKSYFTFCHNNECSTCLLDHFKMTSGTSLKIKGGI